MGICSLGHCMLCLQSEIEIESEILNEIERTGDSRQYNDATANTLNWIKMDVLD